MTSHLNAFQITALETYSNAEFSYLASVSPHHLEAWFYTQVHHRDEHAEG
jgi:hypothetical protein